MNKKIVIALSITGLFIAFVGFILFKKPVNSTIVIFSLQEWIRFPSEEKIDRPNSTLKVVTTSFETKEDTEKSLSQIEEMTDDITQKEQDVDLIIFGEAALGIYYNEENPESYQRSIAVSIPGPEINRLSKLSQAKKVALAIGVVENANDTLYNTLIVFDKNGEIVAKHRKIFLHEFDVLNGITVAKSQIDTCSIENFKIGLAICADANTHFLVDSYKEENIDLLVYPLASNIPFIVSLTDYWPYSREYNAWIVAANRFGAENGEDYSGHIFIADRNGYIHKQSKGFGYITTTIQK